MPAIKKISKEAIIDAAVDVLREGGAAAINARSVAKKLGCSTQPIYPDVNSLVLLSEVVQTSIDRLIKGDVEVMKKQIRSEDTREFKRLNTLYFILFLALTVSPVPLAYYLRITGIVIWAVLAAVTLFTALAVEKKKKQFDIQTYREIIAFSEGKRLDEIEKERENGKRSYQKTLLIMGSGIITLIIAVVIACLVYVNIITTGRRIPASFPASPSGPCARRLYSSRAHRGRASRPL